VTQIPVVVVVLAVAIVVLVGLRKPWPVLVGGAGLAVSTLSAYWLASSLFPTDQELHELDPIGGLNRSPAAMRERDHRDGRARGRIRVAVRQPDVARVKRWLARGRALLAYWRDFETILRLPPIGGAILVAGVAVVAWIGGLPGWVVAAAVLFVWLIAGTGLIAWVSHRRWQAAQRQHSRRTPEHDPSRSQVGGALWHLEGTYIGGGAMADGPLCPADRATLSFQETRYSNTDARDVLHDFLIGGDASAQGGANDRIQCYGVAALPAAGAVHLGIRLNTALAKYADERPTKQIELHAKAVWNGHERQKGPFRSLQSKDQMKSFVLDICKVIRSAHPLIAVAFAHESTFPKDALAKQHPKAVLSTALKRELVMSALTRLDDNLVKVTGKHVGRAKFLLDHESDQVFRQKRVALKAVRVSVVTRTLRMTSVIRRKPTDGLSMSRWTRSIPSRRVSQTESFKWQTWRATLWASTSR
jgi:hypothetical protein